MTRQEIASFRARVLLHPLTEDIQQLCEKLHITWAEVLPIVEELYALLKDKEDQQSVVGEMLYGMIKNLAMKIGCSSEVAETVASAAVISQSDFISEKLR